MKSSARLCVVLLLLCGIACGQRSAPATVLNQPYVATGVETQMVKGSGGLMVEHVTPLLAARDSGGRTWVKKRMIDLRHPNAATDKFEVTMFDPRGPTISTWCTCDGIVRMTYLRPNGAAAVRKGKGKDKGAPVMVSVTSDELLVADGVDQHLEVLPAETILGEPTRGYKMSVGNGAESMTVKSWYAAGLGLDLRTVEETAGMGMRRSEFKEVKRVEPVDGMFYSPAEYTARD